MEIFMLMMAIICFVLIPPALIYAMFAHPEEFGPPGPRARDMKGYQRDFYDDFCDAVVAFFIIGSFFMNAKLREWFNIA